MKRETIAVDVDDVLALSAGALIDFSNETWGTDLSVDDYDEDWTTMWGVSHDEAVERSLIWHASEAFQSKAPREDGPEALRELLARGYRLIVATSRKRTLLEHTTGWLETHYRGIFSEVHFSGIWDDNSAVAHMLTKAEMCRRIGADFLVDDQPKHCIGAAEVGVPSVLFGDYSWNRGDALPSNVTRCVDWLSVLGHFDARG